jgi:hypothetical protein
MFGRPPIGLSAMAAMLIMASTELPSGTRGLGRTSAPKPDPHDEAIRQALRQRRAERKAAAYAKRQPRKEQS